MPATPEVTTEHTENEIKEIAKSVKDSLLQQASQARESYLMGQDEFLEMSFRLQKYHAIFYKFWHLMRPIFDTSIPTAAVFFDPETAETLFMKINPVFWRSQNWTQKVFVVCHECTHLVLNHGARMLACGRENMAIANKAADLVVNHTLIEKFDFKRKVIDPTDIYCWVDKFFKPEDNVGTEESFEFYYEKIKNNGEGGKGGGQLVDSHDGFLDPATCKKVIDELDKILSPEEKKTIQSIIEKNGQKTAGDGEGGQFHFMDYSKMKTVKKKWETVIKDWAKWKIKMEMKAHQQWVQEPRRLSFFSGRNIMLPSDYEDDYRNKEKDKIEVYFFLDTSGSCWGLKERFFSAAASLPTDKFDVKLFCFDTTVYPTTLESGKVYGGGGTQFDIIENYIQKTIQKEGGAYPSACFLISDGAGNHVNPAFPDRWYWFLSDDYFECIPQKSHVFKLKDYE